LRRRLDVAKAELVKQEEAFQVFSVQQIEHVGEWKAQVEAYERDNTLKNPYESEIKGLTEMQVRLQLEEQEEKELAAGVPRVHEITPSHFVTLALDLEDEQREVRVQAELKRAKSTALQINLRSLRRKLSSGIDRLRSLQATFSPASLVALAALKLPPETRPEDMPLLLPSALTAAQRTGGGCMSGIWEMEKQLREAQCRSALILLRNQLHVKSRLLLYKEIHSRHQGMNTRSRTIVARNESKIRLHSEKYQAAWRALLAFADGVESRVGWDRLRKEDIRCLADPEVLSKREQQRRAAHQRELLRNMELAAMGEFPLIGSRSSIDEDEDDGNDEAEPGDAYTLGESRRQISWIWTVAGKSATDVELLQGKVVIDPEVHTLTCF
ncbi:hypothetical protein GGX14DRAFT_378391, partial [Mycena pura]